MWAGKAKSCVGSLLIRDMCYSKKYAFWVSGSQGSGGYANLTNWFEISDGCGKREGSAKLFLA